MVFESIKHGATPVTPSEDHTMPRWFSRPKFRISGLKIHRLKPRMEGKKSNECSVFFLWTRKAFGYESSFKEFNDVFFTGERKMSCLKFISKAAKFLKTFHVHFLASGQELRL